MNEDRYRLGNCLLAALVVMIRRRTPWLRAVWYRDGVTPHFYVMTPEGWIHFRHREDVLPEPLHWLWFHGTYETIDDDRMSRIVRRHARKVVDTPFVDMGDPPGSRSEATVNDDDADVPALMREASDALCRLRKALYARDDDDLIGLAYDAEDLESDIDDALEEMEACSNE